MKATDLPANITVRRYSTLSGRSVELIFQDIHAGARRWENVNGAWCYKYNPTLSLKQEKQIETEKKKEPSEKTNDINRVKHHTTQHANEGTTKTPFYLSIPAHISIAFLAILLIMPQKNVLFMHLAEVIGATFGASIIALGAYLINRKKPVFIIVLWIIVAIAMRRFFL